MFTTKIFKKHENCHPYDSTITAERLYENTINKKKQLMKMGYNIISIWESDFDALQNRKLDDGI